MPNPPAGWYADPDLVNTRRYWDGEDWTDHRQEKSVLAPPSPSKRDSGWSWPVRFVVGVVIAVVAVVVFIRIVQWAGSTGESNAIDPDDLATSIEADLRDQDLPSIELECDDVGDVEKGDITYCRGMDREGEKLTVKVTFDDDGGYSWETL